MKFWKVLAVLLLLGARPAAAGEAVTITVEGHLFDIAVTEPVPVADVLAAIADQFGASLEGVPEGQTVGPLRLVRVSLHQALTELLQKRSFSLKYANGAAEPSTIIIAGAVKKTASLGAQELNQLPAQGDLGGLFNKLIRQPPNIVQGNPLQRTLQANPILKKLQECGMLLQQPENRGQKSETLVTAEGEACPANLTVPAP